MTTESGQCLICGHTRAEHATCSSGAYWCNGSGCTCDGFEPTGGGDHDPRDQMGVDPTGPAATRVGGAAGPPDLDHAIQPDDEDVRLRWPCVCPVGEEHDPESGCRFNEAKAVDVHAWREQAVLLQATRDRLADLEETARAVLSCLHAGNVFTAESVLRHALDGPAAQEEGGTRPFRAYPDGGGGAYVQCRNCGSDATHWDPADGWSCSACGASDSDETAAQEEGGGG